MDNSLIKRLDGVAPRSIPLSKKGQLNDSDWQLAGVPLGDGNFWMYQDRKARIRLGNDEIEINIPRFSAHHDQVQIFDNPKQLYLTKSGYEPGPAGLLGFSCRMKAEISNGDLSDYRDGFCAFNVLDFASAMVFDIVSNGRKIWAIYERLFIPGLTTPEQAFTNVVPVKRETSPDEFLQCMVIYDGIKDRAEYYVDGQLVYSAENVPVKIEKLQTGFGIITLHPIENGKSVSCKGQGGRGNWGGFAFFRK